MLILCINYIIKMSVCVSYLFYLASYLIQIDYHIKLLLKFKYKHIKMLFFSFEHDKDSTDDENNRLSSALLNNKNENIQSAIRRHSISVMRMPRIEMKSNFPIAQRDIYIPIVKDLIRDQIASSSFTPTPPIVRNQYEKGVHKMVKKFINKFQNIWILIAQPNHKAVQKFSEIYNEEKLSNVNHNLQNLLAPQDYKRASLFPKQGLQVRIMMDYFSYANYARPQMKQFENDPKILQIFVQSQRQTLRGVRVTKKIKNTHDLVNFIEKQVKSDVERSRKDKPYFNFVHSNSTPQMFNRRSIVKSCISLKLQSQLIQNNDDFLPLLIKYNNQNRDAAVKNIRKTSYNEAQTQKMMNDVMLKHQKWQKISTGFIEQLKKIVLHYYPIEKQHEETKKQVYSWVLGQYSLQSPIYQIVNNTLRYCNTQQKVRPLSTFIKYLFDAIKYYFTVRYRQINFNTVYRGSRVSLVEQRSFVQGRIMWNLGFISTSRSKKVAEGFIARFPNNVPQNQKVLIIIEISKKTSQIEYLWNQEGFFSMDKIPDIRHIIIPDEQQVLFNPLNIFKIMKWSQASRTLVLRYSPHLQILENRKKGMKITPDEEELLKSISKLKDGDFDKGQQLLQEGDPASAVKFYQQTNQSGSNLSFAQKSNYIKGLMEVCNIQKMQAVLQQSLQQQKNAQKQVQSIKMTEIQTIQKISDSVQALTLFQQTTDFQAANQKAQKTKQKAEKLSIEMPTQQVLLLQARTCIELARVKYEISETLQSIKQSIRGLKIIDQLSQINFLSRLYHIGKDLKQIRKVKITQDMVNLKYILSQQQLGLNIEQEKQKALQKIEKIRSMNFIEQKPISFVNSSSIIRGSRTYKQSHQQAQKLLQNYFKQRDVRNQIQKLQQKYVFAYWEVQRLKIERESISQKQQISWKQKVQICQQKLFNVKNDYKQLFQNQVKAYQVLYRNIYKTSINVQPCLQSYHKNLYARYERFIRQESKYQQQSIDKAIVLYKYGEILYQYGQIIEKPKMGNSDANTSAQMLGEKFIKQAQQVIQNIQKKQSKIMGRRAYTYQKSEINRALTRYFKKKTIDKQQVKKLAVTKASQTDSIKSGSKISQKSENFKQMIKILNDSKQLIESDTNISQSMYKIKNSSQKIQLINQSSNIQVQNQLYIQRLKSCKSQYDDVVYTVQKCKQKYLMESNINMAHLYLLMAQNQFRLGLIKNAEKFLQNCNHCLNKSLKLNKQNQNQNQPESQLNKKSPKINKQKLLLGNKTHIGYLRICAHIATYYGASEQKKKMIQILKAKKQVMYQIMYEPLNEAELDQSIGIVVSSLVIMYREMGFRDAEKAFISSIKIREKLLGPYNKENAKGYSYLVQLLNVPDIKLQHYTEICNYFMAAQQIYNRIDPSQDSMLIIFRMQLQSNFFICSYKQKQACKLIIKGIDQFFSHPNPNLSIEVSKQLYRSSSYLIQYIDFQKDGKQKLKQAYNYTCRLEQVVTETYKISQKDALKIPLLKQKVKILKKIVEVQKKLDGRQLKIYTSLYENQLQKLQILLLNEQKQKLLEVKQSII